MINSSAYKCYSQMKAETNHMLGIAPDKCWNTSHIGHCTRQTLKHITHWALHQTNTETYHMLGIAPDKHWNISHIGHCTRQTLKHITHWALHQTNTETYHMLGIAPDKHWNISHIGHCTRQTLKHITCWVLHQTNQVCLMQCPTCDVFQPPQWLVKSWVIVLPDYQQPSNCNQMHYPFTW